MNLRMILGHAFCEEATDPTETFGEGIPVPDETSLEDKINAASETEVVDTDSEESEVVNYKDFLKEEGLDYDGDDPFDLAKRVAADAKRARELEAQLAQMQQFQQAQLARSQYEQHQPQPQQQAQQPHQLPQHVVEFLQKKAEYEQAASLFSRRPKSFDFSDRVTVDEEGNYKPVNPADYSAIREMNEAAAWQREFNAKVASNLPSFVEYQFATSPVIGHLIQEAIKNASGQTVRQYVEPMQVREKAEQLWMNYADKCYDDSNQQTPYGKVFVETVHDLRAQGMDDPEKVFTLADRMASRAATIATPPAEVKKAQKQLEVLKKSSKKTPSAGGSLPKGEREALNPGKRMTLEERMKLAAGL